MVIDMPDRDERSAMFNSGIDKIYRLGSLRRGCHDARVYRNYSLWFACLQGIRSELNSKLTKEATKKGEPERDIANRYEEIARLYLDKKDEIVVEWNGIKGKVKDIDIYQLLYEYELWLGDIEEKYKFGMPDMDSAYEALK